MRDDPANEETVGMKTITPLHQNIDHLHQIIKSIDSSLSHLEYLYKSKHEKNVMINSMSFFAYRANRDDPVFRILHSD